MDQKFDPYYKWLGIPPREQPANHYRLLGIELFEDDPQVIESAADRQMAHVRSFQAGVHSFESQEVLNALSAAKVCLLRTQQKAAYDQNLRAKMLPAETAAPQTVAPANYGSLPPTAQPMAGMPAMPAVGYPRYQNQTPAPAVAPYYPPATAHAPPGVPPQYSQFQPRANSPTVSSRNKGILGIAAVVIGLGVVVVAALGWQVWSRVEQQRKASVAKRTESKANENSSPKVSKAAVAKPTSNVPDDESLANAANVNESKPTPNDAPPPMPEEKPVNPPAIVVPPPNPPAVVQPPQANPVVKPTPSPAPPGKGQFQITISVPKAPRVNVGPPIEPAISLPAGTPDFRAAYWALALGGNVEIGLPGDARRTISTIAELPADSINLLMVNLSGKLNVTDKGIANFLELKYLESLELADTSITDVGLAQLWRIKGLRFLGLGGNEITDAGLASLQGSTVSQLVLSNTRVTDEGVKNLRRLPYLKYLNLGATSLTDRGLEEIADFDHLELLVINATSVTDDGMPKLGRNVKIAGLVLNQTAVSNTGMKHLSSLTRMQFLGLAKTQVNDDGLAAIEGFTLLDQLDVRDCAITDVGVESISRRSKLTYLNLRGTLVTDLGLERLQRLDRMKKMLVGNARVTNAGVQKFIATVPGCKVTP